MKTLDRYLARQIVPVWIWCIVVFVFMSCLIDLFEHLDEILRYRIPVSTVMTYYLSFVPLVFIKASPLAMLFSASFVTMRLVRHQEILAMSAGGLRLERAVVPFVFVGWLVSLLVFGVNELVVPGAASVYERLRFEAFRGNLQQQQMENVAALDGANRLYHARSFDLKANELGELTVIEHDHLNRPKKTIYAGRAIYTRHGWLLLHGTMTRVRAGGALTSEPEAFMERLIEFPVTPESFRQPENEPETLRIGHLRRLITQLRAIRITNLKRYHAELASKITLPLMNVVMCLIGFVGCARQRHTRGHLRGLGTGLGWGVLYYLAVATGQGVAKEGFLPVILAAWLPHLCAVWACLRALKKNE